MNSNDIKKYEKNLKFLNYQFEENENIIDLDANNISPPVINKEDYIFQESDEEEEEDNIKVDCIELKKTETSILK